MDTASSAPHNDADFTAKLGELRTLLADLAQSAPAAASETFADLQKKAASLCDNCEKKITDATHSMAKTVKEHPIQVAVAVVGAGLLAWWLLHRCSCKSRE